MFSINTIQILLPRTLFKQFQWTENMQPDVMDLPKSPLSRGHLAAWTSTQQEVWVLILFVVQPVHVCLIDWAESLRKGIIPANTHTWLYGFVTKNNTWRYRASRSAHPTFDMTMGPCEPHPQFQMHSATRPPGENGIDVCREDGRTFTTHIKARSVISIPLTHHHLKSDPLPDLGLWQKHLSKPTLPREALTRTTPVHSERLHPLTTLGLSGMRWCISPVSLERWAFAILIERNAFTRDWNAKTKRHEENSFKL